MSIISKVLLGLSVNVEKLNAAMTDELYATEKAYELMKKEALSFRDTYKKVGGDY